MPNGKPGDHPYADIVVHRNDMGEPEIAGRVRALHDIGGPRIRHLISDLVVFMLPTESTGMNDYRRSSLLKHLETIEGLIRRAAEAASPGARQ